jgi:hypothetical protein
VEFKLNDNEIAIGEGNKYPLSDLSNWKLWLNDDGKTIVKIQPRKGIAEVFEVETDLSFKDLDGMTVNPSYWIITWSNGSGTPSCVVKCGDKFMAATFEMGSTKQKTARGFKTVPGFHNQTMGGDDD